MRLAQGTTDKLGELLHQAGILEDGNGDSERVWFRLYQLHDALDDLVGGVCCDVG